MFATRRIAAPKTPKSPLALRVLPCSYSPVIGVGIPRVFQEGSFHPKTGARRDGAFRGVARARSTRSPRARRQCVTGANTDPAQYVFCPFCGGAAPWHSFKFPTAVARLQRLIFRSGAVPTHMVDCAGAARCKIFTLKYLYTIIQDHSTKSRTARITLFISLYDRPCELYCGLG